MSYLVLARKCRPQVFEEVLGQGHVSQTLQNAIKSGRVAHAYLFSGPRGVGKTSVARILAKALNCAEGPTPSPCNQCVSCREITQGFSLDVQEIDGASNRGIDDVRELRENIKYLPAQGRHKIYIVDEVHMLTGEAFNALLKTLEEPPAHAIFIFATTELNKVPLTIYSRCQSFNFRRVAPDVIAGHLKTVARSEGVAVEEAALRLIARQAEGSIRDALSLLDQILAFSTGEITEKQVQEIMGFVDRRIIMEMIWALIENRPASILDLVSEIYEFGYDLKQFLKELIEHFRNMLLIKIGADKGPLLDLSREEIDEFSPKIGSVSLDFLQDGLHFLIQSETELRRSTQPRLSLEMILLRLARFHEVVPAELILEKLEQLEGRWSRPGLQEPVPIQPSSAPSTPPRPGTLREEPIPYVPEGFEEPVSGEPDTGRAHSPGSSPPTESERVSKESLVEYIRQHNLPLSTYLGHAEPRLIEGRILEWDFGSNAFHQGLLEGNSNKKKLEKLFQDYFKKKVQLRFVGQETQAPKRKREAAAATQQHRKKSIQETLEHPRIKDVIDIFQAEVAEVKTPKGTS
jgi:DNA polymerase-3 subunit gamma/tau